MMLNTVIISSLFLAVSVAGAAVEERANLVASNLTTIEHTLAPAANPIYDISCSKYPNVCQNWCYFVYCKTQSQTPWTVTVDRTANLRPQSDCKTPNRCSHTNPPTGWPKEPNAGWSCDEQPKNTNLEGGANAATRCMPAGENSGEGSTWSNFINKPGAVIPNNSQVDVSLVFTGTSATGYCGLLANPPTSAGCTPPVQSNSPGVATDGPRQR